MNSTTRQFKQQLPRNMFLQVLSFITTVAVGICLVPYLVGHLGRAAYGLIPIAGALTQYVALISHSISSAVTRFLTIALQQNDTDEANRIFNTALFSYLAIGLIQIPVFALLIWNANTIFSIPQELYRDAIILLICSAAVFLINLACSVFNVPMYANNRLDISRSLDVARLILRLAGIVTLFAILGPALRYVGYVDLALTLVLCVTRILIASRLAPMLQVAFRYYDWHKVRQLTGMGGWLLVNHVGVLLFLRTDIWVCNRFVSAESAGDYAALSQWPNLIRLGGSIISGVIAPMVMIYYARGEIESLVRLNKLSVRVLSLFVAIPISVLCVLSSPLLRIWLGESFERLAPLMVIMLCHLVVNVAVSPLLNTKTALNKVKWPGLVTIFAGILSLFLAIFLARNFNWGIYGVAIAGAFVLTLKNITFVPIYSALILHRPWHTFLSPILWGQIFFIGLTTFGLVVSRWVRPTSVFQMSAVSLIIGIAGVVMGWFILSKPDRTLMIDLMPGRFKVFVTKIVQI